MHRQSHACFIGEDHATLVRMGASANRYSMQQARNFSD
jgi:hypothetical protein